MDSNTKSYYNFLTSSAGGGGGGVGGDAYRFGGNLPVFHGAPRYHQYGAGIGDFFRGLFRTFLPVAMRGASTFLNETLKAQQDGVSLKDAAKAALSPAFGDVVTSALEQLKTSKSGRGRKRRKSKLTSSTSSGIYKKRKNKNKKAKRVTYNF